MKKIKIPAKLNNRFSKIISLCLLILLIISLVTYKINKTRDSREEALDRTNYYLKNFNSKKNIYNLLTGKFDNFKPEVAQYTVDHLKVDWKEIALKSAEINITDFNSDSKEKMFELLNSPTKGKFTKEEARYAVDHLQVDWNQNALRKAMKYTHKNDSFSKKKIFEILSSPDGDQFTKKEAQYAVDSLQVDWNSIALQQAIILKSKNYEAEAIKKALVSEKFKFTKKQAQYAIDHLSD